MMFLCITETVHWNPRKQLFDRIWNGWALRFWNAIQNQSHSTPNHISTIQNMFSIRAPTLYKFERHSIIPKGNPKRTMTWHFFQTQGLLSFLPSLLLFLPIVSSHSQLRNSSIPIRPAMHQKCGQRCRLWYPRDCASGPFPRAGHATLLQDL